jgi:hypothetical protein
VHQIIGSRKLHFSNSAAVSILTPGELLTRRVSKKSAEKVVAFVLPILKGQCHEIFDFRFSTWISFYQAPDYIIPGLFRIFSKIRVDIRSSRCTTGVVDTGGAP